MKIFVQVKAGAKKERIEVVEGTQYKVWVKELPVGGKANEAVAKALSRHLKVPKSLITIISGFKARKKVVEVLK